MNNALKSMELTLEAIDIIKLAIEQRGYALPNELERLNTLADLLFTESRWVVEAVKREAVRKREKVA